MTSSEPQSQIKIISGHAIFNENAVVLHKKYGWVLESTFDPQPNDIYVVLGAHELAHQLLEIQFRKNNSFGYIIFNSEQVNSQFFKNKYYLSLMKRNIVMDYNTLTANYLKEIHDIKVLSYFFFEFMKSETEEPNDRKYDVTFIGSKNENRDKLINQLKEDHPELNFYVDFEWKHSSCESLTEILNQSKVVLNIPYYENNPLETHRINKALACGCDVISLMSADEDANEFYKDYVYMTTDISGTLQDYILDKPHQTFTKKSYQELVKTLSQKFSPHMLFIIDQVQKKLSAISNGGNPTDKEEEKSIDNTISERLPVCEVEDT